MDISREPPTSGIRTEVFKAAESSNVSSLKSIKSRVMIDAAFFREINPNSGSRPRVTEPADMEWVWHSSSESSNGPPSRQVKSVGIEPVELKDDELLICCPTVPGFSFGDKLWGET
jgi:hypothetical protein